MRSVTNKTINYIISIMEVICKKEDEHITISSLLNNAKTIAIISLLVYSIFATIYSINTTQENADMKVEYDSIVLSYENLSSEYTTLNDTNTAVTTEFNDLTEIYNNLEEELLTARKSIVSLDNVVTKLQATNTSLARANDKYLEDLTKLSKRSELFEKYEYAIYNDAYERTDISYDQLETAEELCKENGVDIDYVLATVMVESGGDSTAKNSKSSASGYGQLIKSTAEYVYEVIMDNGENSYNHSLAMDGNTNLEIMVNYISYLKDNSSSTDEIVKKYRGVEDVLYKRKLDEYLAQNNKSLSTVCMN